MPRISTNKSNRNLRGEYRLRFLIMFMIIVICALLLVLLSFLPSYTMLDFYEKAYRTGGINREQVAIQKNNQEYNQKVQTTYELSQKVNTKSSSHVEVIKKLFEYANNSITFSVIELQNIETGLSITLRGQAIDRESLLLFEDKIKADNNFAGFKIPIDVLTKQTNISFNVSFTYHEN